MHTLTITLMHAQISKHTSKHKHIYTQTHTHEQTHTHTHTYTYIYAYYELALKLIRHWIKTILTLNLLTSGRAKVPVISNVCPMNAC